MKVIILMTIIMTITRPIHY